MSELARVVRGRVTLPGDDGFVQAAQPWSRTVDQSGVLAVVEAADRDDVAALVRYARAAGVAIAAQATGHGASGSATGTILLRTNRLGGVRIDPRERVARVGAGVKWAEVLAAASPHGLTGLAGSSAVVGVVGFTLAGGLSWFGRKFGLAADSARVFEVVDAEGGFATVTAESDPELFWALRGRGADLAIVTELEFDLHPAPAFYGGRVLWPADRAAAVLDMFREVTPAAPDELTVSFDMLDLPGQAPTAAITVTYLGSAAEAQELLRPFDKVDGRVGDTRAELEVAQLGGITSEPDDPTPVSTRSQLLTGLDGPGAGALLEPLGPLFSTQVRHLGGALSGRIAEPYHLHMVGVPASAEAAGAIRARMDAMTAGLGELVSGRKAFSGLVSGDSAADALSTGELARLRALKQARDPNGRFRGNFPA